MLGVGFSIRATAQPNSTWASVTVVDTSGARPYSSRSVVAAHRFAQPTSLMDGAASYPWNPSRSRRRPGISVRQGQKIKAYLAADGLIEEQEERTSTGKLLRIRLTEKGRHFLARTQ